MYKIPEKSFLKRLDAWRTLRDHVEKSSTPFEDVAEFFNKFPKVKIYTDPYNQLTWPTPWQLIEENEYCPFNLLLAIAYTFQLCNRFNHIQPKITITVDKYNKTVYYLLFLDNKVYGYLDDNWIDENELPKSLTNTKIYLLDPLN
jgi:hypothetical protein